MEGKKLRFRVREEKNTFLTNTELKTSKIRTRIHRPIVQPKDSNEKIKMKERQTERKIETV